MELQDINATRFAGMGVEDVRRIAVLSGCDYVRSLANVGILTAHKAYNECGNLFETLCSLLRTKQNTYANEAEYVCLVIRALLTFNYSIVYDIIGGCCKYLGEMKEDKFLMDISDGCLGKLYTLFQTREICEPSSQLQNSAKKLREYYFSNKFTPFPYPTQQIITFDKIDVNLLN